MFAGYKPLFLGANYNQQDLELAGFESDYQRLLEEASGDKLIPWDASAGGLLYSDTGFGDVPRDVKNSLRFFSAPEHQTGKGKKKTRYIKFKVHNPIVDESGGSVKISPRTEKKEYKNDEYVQEANQFQLGEPNDRFIREKELQVQYVINSYKARLNKELKNKYHTELLTKTPIHSLPRYIFFQRKCISNELLFKRTLYKVFLKETHILFEMIMGFRDTEYNKRRFEKSYIRNIQRLVSNLSRQLYMRDNLVSFGLVDALVLQRPKSLFGRIFWINPRKRLNVVVKKKNDMNFWKFKHYNYYPSNTKNRITVPVSLVCKSCTVHDANVTENINEMKETADAVLLATK